MLTDVATSSIWSMVYDRRRAQGRILSRDQK